MQNFYYKSGNGSYPSCDVDNEEMIELPPSMITNTDIITEIYGSKFQSPDHVSQFSNVAILAPKNDHCQEINNKVLDLIPGNVTT